MLNPITKFDIFAQWFTKINATIDAVNTINPTTVFSLTSPANQDILVYDSGTGLFKNINMNTLATQIITQNKIASSSHGYNFFITNQRQLL